MRMQGKRVGLLLRRSLAERFHLDCVRHYRADYDNRRRLFARSIEVIPKLELFETWLNAKATMPTDRKSTRLNSSHVD